MRVDTDFNNISREITLIIEDLRISMGTELDRVFRSYIDKYAALKTEAHALKHIKRKIA